MKKRRRSATENTTELRRRAEDRISEGRIPVLDMTEKDIVPDAQRLLQELQVHQIELEMQNEELQRARAEAEDGLARYSDLYELAPVGYLTIGPEGAIQKVNLSGARLFGLERSRMVGMLFTRLIGAESRHAFEAFLRKVFDTEAKESCEVVVHSGVAAPLTFELTGTAVDEGKECRVVATDITGRKRAEELMAIRLRLQEFATAHSQRELLQKTLDEVESLTGSHVGFYCLVGEDQLGLSLRARSTGTLGSSCAAPWEDRRFDLQEAPRLADCADQRAPVIHDDCTRQPHSGWLPEDCAPVIRELLVPTLRHDHVMAILGVANKATAYTADDIASAAYLADVAWELLERKRAEHEREELQTRLMQSQKLEAVGTLAGGIAHDFNNILAGIMGGLTLLDLDLGESSEHHPDIQEMMALVERAADLTKQLLGFARRGKYDVRPLDLARVLNKVSAMFGRTRKDIIIETGVAPTLRAVLMDHVQLEQVLLNLFVNAGQAMPNGGRLLLSAENAEDARNQGTPHGVAPRHFIRLVVTDTGIGMDSATQARIFEPFFTTKGPSQGTGLGLASVYGIIQSHGGTITVESEPEKGARFTLLLPATDRPIAEKAPGAAILRGMGTILIVDDEEPIVQAYARVLHRIGYEVLTASGGREAVDLMRQHGEGISLVILDMTMPEMSGRQTYDAIQEIAPGTKVLLSSGYSIDGQAQEMLEHGCNGFIQKPFDVATLAARLRELM
jgi:PAS domain S-box-containing protein